MIKAEINMKKQIIFLAFLIVSAFSACKKDQDYKIYHKFEDQVWRRFNILQFEIPISTQKDIYDVSLFTHIRKDYEFDYLVPQTVGIRSFFLDRSAQRQGSSIVWSLGELEERLFG